MSTPYIRFMNGDMPFWDFVAEMGGPQYSQAFAGAQADDNADPQSHHRGFQGPTPPGAYPWAGPTPSDGSEGHPFSRDFTHRPHPRQRDRRGRHGRRHRHEHEHATEGEGEANVNDASRATREDVDMTPATDDTATITLQDNEKTDTRNVDDTPASAPDPEISTPQDEDDTSGSSSSDSDSDSDCSHCQRPRRHRRHGHRGPGGWEGRGGRGGFGGRGGWGGRGAHHHFHHPHHPHHGPRFDMPHGGLGGGRGGLGGFGGPGPVPGAGFGGLWGGFDRRRGGRHADPFGFGMGGRGGRRGPGPQAAAPTFDDVMRAFARDPRLRGLGDTISNVLRATSTFVSPDASGSGQQTGATEAGAAADAATRDATAAIEDVDFTPAADIYDHPEAYVVHVVLPGAKKEDVSLSWDAESSELQVAGVVTRDGDEHMLQTLALAERNVGVFQRCLKLGTDKVDGDAISAKMQDGILVITVPKKVEETWTEVRKVDIL